ncbi:MULTISPECIES: carbon storage regulator CsrA [Priestia]|jgi:carbon storage regulator|uniref:Translational regulator CsrA n=5 Tax=Priestia megaterium TaxID=1404 RepID=A0A109GAJ9_PRIMG|nr:MULTISPECIES: carbon storage regulator CsrA [Priestia]KRD82918.1 carbon storage regulator [Bacillus sp. Root147]MBU8854685.1 carbon storage regulator CsrA [Bacillus sp. FJAT-26377]MCJ7991244.1 carbon storage regulator CsrA [Priestia sp. OVS21]RCX22211.1 carbon storage regulator CsrA [Bacillus sp. AG236]TCN08955.1 carbon storage regulator CsrA [Bacillus sp. BK006]
MLVLTRKLNETIKIGDEIEVTVLAVNGDQVKLGIQAPKSVDIHRQEIYEEIRNENKSASQITLHAIDMLKQLPKKK